MGEKGTTPVRSVKSFWQYRSFTAEFIGASGTPLELATAFLSEFRNLAAKLAALERV
jgi:hypothetical protein